MRLDNFSNQLGGIQINTKIDNFSNLSNMLNMLDLEGSFLVIYDLVFCTVTVTGLSINV